MTSDGEKNAPEGGNPSGRRNAGLSASGIVSIHAPATKGTRRGSPGARNHHADATEGSIPRRARARQSRRRLRFASALRCRRRVQLVSQPAEQVYLGSRSGGMTLPHTTHR